MLQITGKIISIHPVNEGVSQSGKQWKKGGFSIEVPGEYPTKVAFTMFGEEKLAYLSTLPVGTDVTVDFSPESREYNERWYTDLRCVRVNPVMAQQPAVQMVTPQYAAMQQFYQAPLPPTQPKTAMPTQEDPDLPF